MRRLIALLALLSGLAAAGAPVSAAMLSGACEQVASAETTQAGKQASCVCQSDRKSPSGKIGSDNTSRPRKPVVIYIPTVQFGADRAFE